MTHLQQEQFIKWLDEQRIKSASNDGPISKSDSKYYSARLSAFESVKQKFQSLLTTPTTDKQ